MAPVSYLQFHLFFNLPLLVLLWFVPGSGGALLHWPVVLLILGIVFVFTSPWDNYAVAKGIWGFPDGRYLFRVGWLPVEEYAFFAVQSLQVMLLCAGLRGLTVDAESALATRALQDAWAQTMVPWGLCGVLLVVWALLGWRLGGRFGNGTRFHYAWHLFYWMLPVLALQWLIAYPLLSGAWVSLVGSALAVGLYLSLADFVAIRLGIWHFDEKQITGFRFGGQMPWEEAAFFFVTSFLVAQSYLMLAP